MLLNKHIQKTITTGIALFTICMIQLYNLLKIAFVTNFVEGLLFHATLIVGSPVAGINYTSILEPCETITAFYFFRPSQSRRTTLIHAFYEKATAPPCSLKTWSTYLYEYIPVNILMLKSYTNVRRSLILLLEK